MKVEYLKSLQKIADTKTLFDLRNEADYVINAHHFTDDEDAYDKLEIAGMYFELGVQFGLKAAGKRVFAVTGEDAVGESTFYFIERLFEQVVRRLKALEDS